jgi:hypothetical protein
MAVQGFLVSESVEHSIRRVESQYMSCTKEVIGGEEKEDFQSVRADYASILTWPMRNRRKRLRKGVTCQFEEDGTS